MRDEMKCLAQKIACVLDSGNVGLANDMYNSMLKETPLCKWEQLAFGEVVRRYRKSCLVFVTVCEDKPVYRLDFHGKHIGYFESKEELDRKIEVLMF